MVRLGRAHRKRLIAIMAALLGLMTIAGPASAQDDWWADSSNDFVDSPFGWYDGGYETVGTWDEPTDAWISGDVYAEAVDGDSSLDTSEDIGGWNDATGVYFTRALYPGSLSNVAFQVNADHLHMSGIDGAGVDVAMIDSGVVPVPGLDDADQVIHGPDLSLEAPHDQLRHLDTFGHGTHLAGIIIGDHPDAPGIASGSRLVSLKVASHDGAVDVTQVIAAIDWVVQNRDADGLNIRVLNLSYGTVSKLDYVTDSLAHAVQQAWDAGIVVVVSGGNDGEGVPLRSPAFNPDVIAVGAVDGDLLGGWTDPIADFSSCGVPGRTVDVLAPGRSIVSYRNPGSHADVHFPKAVVGDDLMMGSGTSQAAAVVSGSVALLLQDRPELTPDDVKAILVETATPVSTAGLCGNAGVIDLAFASFHQPWGSTEQGHTTTTGGGDLDATRGGAFIEMGGVVLEGNMDIFGARFEPKVWATAAQAHKTWDNGIWNGNAWIGRGWVNVAWSKSPVWAGGSWSGGSWSGGSWSGGSWSGGSWSGGSWSGGSWSGGSWSGGSWSGGSWSGGSWSGGSWSGGSWSGGTWS